MKPTLALFSLLGLTPIAACATRPVPAPVEIIGLEALAPACTDQPGLLTTADIEALLAQYPDAAERERRFWVPRDTAHRACELQEKKRADDLLAVIEAHNQAVRGHR